MQISAKTKISELIKVNPASIDAIASINKHFLKLKNPVLRKILASRVTIEDAARIGHTTVEEFFQKLEPLGFVPACYPKKEAIKEAADIRKTPVFMWSESPVTMLDVRPDLLSGQDPFKRIMAAISSLPEGTVLCVINTFEPLPLINLLNKKGFDHYTKKDQAEVVYTYFKKTGNGSTKNPEEPNTSFIEKDGFEEMTRLFKNKIQTIDVRDMEMPMPMISILSALEKLPDDFALFVQHKKVPQFLLAELRELNFYCLIHNVEEGNVQLLIYK